jgi:hypothetical protein
MQSRRNQAGYNLAQRSYAALGINTEAAIAAARRVPISMHCWQVDDVAGFEAKDEAVSGGGILATGNYPGRGPCPSGPSGIASASGKEFPPTMPGCPLCASMNPKLKSCGSESHRMFSERENQESKKI